MTDSADRTAQGVDRSVQRRMFELMTLMRVVDERIVSGISTGEFLAIYYSHKGQEAIAAALGVTLRPSDQMVTTYRGLHDHIGKGSPLRDLLAGILGKDLGAGRGRSHMLSLSHPEIGAMLSTGIVGGGLPIAVGLALSAQLEGSDRVTAVTFGDGASNTGSFHEAANLASLWNLPLLLVCQNNLYGEKTTVSRSMRVERIADRAAAYGMPGITTDGNDPDALHVVFAEAVERARGGGGPSLVECVTYRLRGHSQGDDMSYMPAEERKKAEERDPLPTYRRRLIDQGVCSEDELAKIERDTVKYVDGIADEVLAAPGPAPQSVSDDLYDDSLNVPV